MKYLLLILIVTVIFKLIFEYKSYYKSINPHDIDIISKNKYDLEIYPLFTMYADTDNMKIEVSKKYNGCGLVRKSGNYVYFRVIDIGNVI